MRVAMIGTGYVGLVSGACFADFGHTVTCIDKDAGKIARLEAGEIPIFEPGLEALVAASVREGRLHFTTEAAEAVRGADAVFIAVGTPSRRGDGYADLSYVYAAAEEVAGLVEGFTVVVTKSTVPVGTGDEVEAIFKRVRPEADVAVVSNPEFLREGAAIEDFKRPDRVVVGAADERAKGVMRELYRPLFLNETPILFTERRTSELIKYAANAYEADEGADAVVVVTEWDRFRALDLDRLKAVMKTPILVDLRNVYPPAETRARGFTYESVGRDNAPNWFITPPADAGQKDCSTVQARAQSQELRTVKCRPGCGEEQWRRRLG